jgi:cobalt-zinc-cadmium efflux system outer membrane protein
MDRCLTLAREQSPRIRSAHNALRSAELSRDELMTTGLPQVRLNATSIYAPSSRHFGYDPVLSNIGELAGQVIVQQSLYDGGVRSLRSDQSRLDLERLDHEQRLAGRDLTLLVTQAFVEALRADREMALQHEGVLQLIEYLNIVKQLSRGGNASPSDVLKTELQLSNAQLAFQKASESATLAKYSLLELIGSGIDTSFVVSGTLDDTTGAAAAVASVPDIPDSTSNLELAIAALELERNILETDLTRHEAFPTVTLMGDAGFLTSGENLRLPSADRESFAGFSLGVSVDVPLLNWGATDLRIQQRQLAVENLRLDMVQLQRSVTTGFQKAQLQILKARERLGAIRANRTSAEDIYALAKSKFVGGGALSLEVLSAQQLLTETKLSELQTMADMRLLHARLEQLRTR